MNINKNLNLLSKDYLFTEIGEMIKNRDDVINLSIGDVKLPLPDSVIMAGKKAADELRYGKSFRGYPPESGYEFLKQAVKRYYALRNIEIDMDEIFISDGIKSDMSLFLNLFGKSRVLLPSPSYPAYVEANVIRGNEIYLYNGVTDKQADIIVICSPDNPTGRAMSKDELSEWIKVAKKNKSVIFYDAAYEAFISSDAPRSIFEIDGARDCAVEFCSLSKTAGFTGIRCGYTVVPKECGLSESWKRAKSCLSNGVSYISQRMAECALTTGLNDVIANIMYYKQNARLFTEAMKNAVFTGGVDSPYIWVSCDDSRKAFKILLDEYGLAVTPGIGFGSEGEGHLRINCFCTYENALSAAKRLKEYAEKISNKNFKKLLH